MKIKWKYILPACLIAFDVVIIIYNCIYTFVPGHRSIQGERLLSWFYFTWHLPPLVVLQLIMRWIGPLIRDMRSQIFFNSMAVVMNLWILVFDLAIGYWGGHLLDRLVNKWKS